MLPLPLLSLFWLLMPLLLLLQTSFLAVAYAAPPSRRSCRLRLPQKARKKNAYEVSVRRTRRQNGQTGASPSLTELENSQLVPRWHHNEVVR